MRKFYRGNIEIINSVKYKLILNSYLSYPDQMETAFVISAHVINTINSLPAEERIAVTTALAAEMILGADTRGRLTPMQEVLYSMIRQYVERDTMRATSPTPKGLDATDFESTFRPAAAV